MKKLENKEKVTEITIRPKAYTKCQIGQDWFMNDLEIIFYPGRYYPDYMEVDSFIDQNIEGQEMNIEHVARAVFDFMMQYDPAGLKVINHIRNCKTHSDVDVIIAM